MLAEIAFDCLMCDKSCGFEDAFRELEKKEDMTVQPSFYSFTLFCDICVEQAQLHLWTAAVKICFNVTAATV